MLRRRLTSHVRLEGERVDYETRGGLVTRIESNQHCSFISVKPSDGIKVHDIPEQCFRFSRRPTVCIRSDWSLGARWAIVGTYLHAGNGRSSKLSKRADADRST